LPIRGGIIEKMNLDAAIFMFCAWGFTLGLLAFCIIKLIQNPQNNSALNEERENKFEPKLDLDD